MQDSDHYLFLSKLLCLRRGSHKDVYFPTLNLSSAVVHDIYARVSAGPFDLDFSAEWQNMRVPCNCSALSGLCPDAVSPLTE
jgi:hypothetical protein